MADGNNSPNQIGSFTRNLVKITSDTGKVPAGNVRALSNAYNAVLATARRWSKDNQSARVFPELKDGTSRSKVIDFTGDNAVKLSDALRLELNEALSDRDWELFSPALAVEQREQKYNTIRVNLDKAFLKKFENRFKEAGAEVKPLGDAGMVEIAIPEGAQWSGSGKNHNQRVDAWSSVKKAVNAERKRMAAERVETRQYLTEGGVDPDKFERMTPKEQKTVLGLLGKTHRNKTLTEEKGARHALVQSEIDKARALTGELDGIVFNDPLTPLPDADVRKLSPEASAYRRLYRRAEDSEQLLNSPEEIKRIRMAELKKRAIQKQAEQEYYSDPANRDDPLYWEMIKRRQKIMNREDKARYLERERTPGTPEFMIRQKMNFKAAGFRREALEQYIADNPGSPLAVQRREQEGKRQKRKVASSIKRTVSGAKHLVRNMTANLITTVLDAVARGIALLAKINNTVSKIGDDVRRQTQNDLTYNFSSGLTKDWQRFAAHKGFVDPDALFKAAGYVADSWSSPLFYSDAGFAHLAPYLKRNTVDLVRMSSGGGDQNVLGILTSVVQDLVDSALRGEAGVKSGIPVTQAFSENLTALRKASPALAQLMHDYFYDLTKEGGDFRKDALAAGKDTSFMSWITQGGWNKRYASNRIENGLTNAATDTAVERFRETLQQFKGAFGSLKTDVLERLLANMPQLVENVRAILTNWIARYFPAFAAKEENRALVLNEQTERAARRDLPSAMVEASSALSGTGYSGDIAGFKTVWDNVIAGNYQEAFDGLTSGDKTAVYNLPGNTDVMFSLAKYYYVKDVIDKIEREKEAKKANSKYVPVHIMYEDDLAAVNAGSVTELFDYQLRKALDYGGYVPMTDTSVSFMEELGVVALMGADVAAKVGGRIVNAAFPDAEEVKKRAESYLFTFQRMKEHPILTASFLSKRGDFDKTEGYIQKYIAYADAAGDAQAAVEGMRMLHTLYKEYGDFAGRTKKSNSISLKNPLFNVLANKLLNTSTAAEAEQLITQFEYDYREMRTAGTKYDDTQNAGARQRELRRMEDADMFLSGVNKSLSEQYKDLYKGGLQQMLDEGRITSVKFDVDEKAASEYGAKVNTKVYVNFGNGYMEVYNKETGLRSDAEIQHIDHVDMRNIRSRLTKNWLTRDDPTPP
jgi:hypothetical protein